MIPRINAEWHTLREVIVHRPGIEMFFGLLDPLSFLYEREFSMQKAIKEHRTLERVLSSKGVKVRRLRKTIIELARENSNVMNNIREFAKNIVKFTGSREHVQRARDEFMLHLYKFDPETLFNILLLQPSLRLEKRHQNAVPKVVLDMPLANLYFMRDQQAVTDKGIVIGRLAKPQRRMETIVTSTFLDLMGFDITLSVKSPGTFEGGDFMPAENFALIGIGDRTNISGAMQLMNGGLDFDLVCLVHQPMHPLIPYKSRDPMINMHLDTYFNIAGERLAVGCKPLLENAYVEVFKRGRKRYIKVAHTNLLDFLKQEKFELIEISTLEQMCYASNFLCIRDRDIVSVDTSKIAPRVMSRLIEKANREPGRYGILLDNVRRELLDIKERNEFFPRKKEVNEHGINYSIVSLEEITGGYGGAHCMTAVIERKD